MFCRCGFNFRTTAAKAERDYESFAVVRDKSWRTMLKREMDVLNAPDEEARGKAIGKSAHYVGSAMVCPKCGRLTLLTPERHEKCVYLPEEPEEGL